MRSLRASVMIGAALWTMGLLAVWAVALTLYGTVRHSIVVVHAYPLIGKCRIELALGLYFTYTVFYALVNQIYATLPFLMLFQIGFLYTGVLSILQQYTGESVMLKTPEVAK